MDYYHQSVLLSEVLRFLEVKKDQWYLDCTLGDGGHSLEILRQGGRVLGIDQDPQALERTRKRFLDEGLEESRFVLKRGNFRDLERLVEGYGPFVGVVMDLGLSTLQLQDEERGFSFLREGPLSMKMDPDTQVGAKELVNVLNKGELYELFTKLGEEKHSKRIVDALDSARKVRLEQSGQGIQTTRELADIIEKAVGRKEKIHPATRVFQALRIAVNDELNALKEGLPQALDVISTNGVLTVITFHSLEDRIVKDLYKDWEDQGIGQTITVKPVVPSQEEVVQNSKSRSSKLRVFKKHE